MKKARSLCSATPSAIKLPAAKRPTGGSSLSGIPLGILLCCFLALLAVLSGCGKKTAPRLPEQFAPGRIAALTARGEKDGVVFEWKAPLSGEDEEGARVPVGYNIYRRLFQREESGDFQQIVSLPPALPNDEIVSYRDTDVSVGAVYEYRIVAVNTEEVESLTPMFVRTLFTGVGSTVQIIQGARRGGKL